MCLFWLLGQAVLLFNKMEEVTLKARYGQLEREAHSEITMGFDCIDCLLKSAANRANVD